MRGSFALFSALLLTMPAQQPAPANEPVIVAVVQQSGLLIPVAQFDGLAWTVKWPEAPPNRQESRPEIPAAWTGGLPFPRTWNLWLNEGGTRAVSITGGPVVDTACGSVWTVPTNYRSLEPVMPNSCPIPIVGVALSTGRPLLPMPGINGSLVRLTEIAKSFEALETRSIDETAAEVSSANYKRQVRQETIDMIDRQLAAGRLPFSGHPLSAAERRKTPMKVALAYRIALDGISFTHVEVRRTYATFETPHDAGCPVTAWRSWLRTDAKGVTALLNPSISVNDCDMKGDEFLLPLGVIVTNGVPHVIAALSGWESQSVGIFGLTPTEAREVARSPVR